MNRNTLIGFILIGFVLLFWPTYLDFVFPEKDTEAQQEKVLSKTERPSQQKKSSPLVVPDNIKAEALKEGGDAINEEEFFYIDTSLFSAVISNKNGGSISSFIIRDHLKADEKEKTSMVL